MARKILIAVLLMTCLGGAILAQEPGVFLPFYFIYDNEIANPDGVVVANRDVVYFENHPLVSEKVKTIGNGFIMNIMRARYFRKFPVAVGNTYKVGIAQASDTYGMNPIDFPVTGLGADKVDLTLRRGEGAGLLPPDGTVPIDITTGSPDIVIRWSTATYPSVDVYRMVGDGTGQYHKDYPGTPVWTKVSAVDTDGEYRDTGYVAADPREAYYKALVAGEDPFVKIPLAWAVGKYDLSLISGYNLSSTPLVPLHGNGIDDVFVNGTGGGLRIEGAQVYSYNSATEILTKALFKSGNWEYSPNTPFDISLGNAYWIRGSAPNRVSALGAVIVTDNIRPLPVKYSLIASPIPTVYATMADASLPARGTDELFYYDAPTGYLEKMINISSVWVNTDARKSAFGLKPGVGYWYRNKGTAFDWTLRP